MNEDWDMIMFGSGPEATAWNFRSAQPPALEMMISVAFGRNDSDKCASVYDAVVRRKSAPFRAEQRLGRLISESKDPGLKTLAETLERKRRELSTALLTSPDHEMTHRGELYTLAAAKEELEYQLREQLPKYDPSHERKINATDLQKVLPPDSALVEIFAFRMAQPIPHSSMKLGRADRHREGVYHAFVLRPDAPIYWYQMGGPFGLDMAVNIPRQKIEASDPQAVDSSYLPKELIWRHIERHLGPATRTVYIAPDGGLARLPWAALPGRGADRVLLA